MDRAAPRRALAPALLGLLLALALAGPASAGQIVWQKGDELWIMGDDGSGQRPFVPLSAAPGMESLSDPHVDPRGNLMVFEGYVDSVPNDSDCGLRCSGVYKWENGTVTRLSLPPAGVGAENISHFDSEPEATGDGRYAFDSWICVNGGTSSQTCSNRLRVGSLAGGDPQDFPTKCDDSLYLDSPSPKPGNPDVLAFIGCREGGFGSPYQLLASGPGRAGETVVGSDDSDHRNPSWRPDGGQIVATEEGEDPGIYVYDGTGGGRRLVLAAPANYVVKHPRFVGSDRIVFDYADDLWTVPASCAGCGLAQATRLTNDATSDARAAWTASNAFGTAGGGTGGGGTGGGGGGGGGGGDTGAGVDTAAPAARALGRSVARLGALLGRGLAATYEVSEAGRLSVVLTVDARTARRLRISARRPVVVARGGATAAGAGRVNVRLRATRSARSRLRRVRSVRAVMRATVTDSAGNSTVVSRRVTLRR